MLVKLNDLNYGVKKEVELLEKFRSKFSNDLELTDKYFVFDYECESCFVELKSRRVTKDKYPDTMIGKNKLDYAEHANRAVYFCFDFTDGLYYWKFNPDDFKNDNVNFRVGGRCDRGKYEYKDYAYIKTSILQKI
jgi:hypothetical protein